MEPTIVDREGSTVMGALERFTLESEGVEEYCPGTDLGDSPVFIHIPIRRRPRCA